MADKLECPTKISRIHNVFHFSMLRKYVSDSLHILKDQLLEIQENLTYEEKPLRVFDRKRASTKTKVILMSRYSGTIMVLRKPFGKMKNR